MSTIGGVKRESMDFSKHVGLFEANVIVINPTEIEFKDILGKELKEDSKSAEYLGTTRDDNNYARIDFWLKEVKDDKLFKATFFLEDKERENKDGTKRQYINNVGVCSWASDPNDLPEWFAARDYRVAYVGEEDLYNFMRTWLNKLDYREAETTLKLEWKKLMKGNVKDLKDQIDGEWCSSIVALATVITKEKDEETREYQGIYTKGFLSPYTLRNFRLINYSDENILEKLSQKKTKDLKPHERFVLQVTGEYGCKDFFVLKDLKEYDPADNVISTNEAMIPSEEEEGDVPY